MSGVVAFARSYAVTMRPYLLFVSGVTGLAGLALGPAAFVGTLPVAFALFLSYGFGQALTDCFQTDTDALSAPYRPLVQGRLRRRDVLSVSLAGLAAAGLVIGVYHPWNLGLAALAVLGLASYTWFKRRWWGGPWYNAWIVALLVPIGLLSGAGPGGAVELSPKLAGTVLAAFFAYANFVLAGYYKDLSADRATGYRTLPVVFGLRAASVVSHGFALLALLACGLAAFADGTPPLAAAALLAAGAGAAALGQARLAAVRHEAEAHRAIAPVVHAYVLLLAGVAAAHRPDWALALGLFYLAFAVVLARRPMSAQI